jgi:general stress protein 26
MSETCWGPLGTCYEISMEGRYTTTETDEGDFFNIYAKLKSKENFDLDKEIKVSMMIMTTDHPIIEAFTCGWYVHSEVWDHEGKLEYGWTHGCETYFITEHQVYALGDMWP